MADKYEFVLLGTDGCHLCEIAQPAVVEIASYYQVTLYAEDIAEAENAADQIAKFGEKIPVLHHEMSGKSLCWPFDKSEIAQFISLCCQL